MTYKCGMHGRPSLAVVNTANMFDKSIKIHLESKGKKIDARSILMLMSIGIMYGDEVTIIIDGGTEYGEKRVMLALINIFENNFFMDV